MSNNWSQAFEKGQELVLVTSSVDAQPNANIVISLGFVEGKILVADSQMKTTIKNLQANKKVCLINKYYRLQGTVEIFDQGKYFNLCSAADKKHPVKHAILITPKEIFDLNKLKKIIL